MCFEEASGIQINEQVAVTMLRTPSSARSTEVVAVPWREWFSQLGSLGEADADKSAAIVVLHAIHERFHVVKQCIDVTFDKKNGCRVTAKGKVETESLALPPCIPKQSKVYSPHMAAGHPHAVYIKEKVMNSTANVATERKMPDGEAVRVATWVVHPEWKMPEGMRDTTAVADEPRSHEWRWSEHVTLHPFWAVRRMTEQQLRQEIANRPEGDARLKPRFNCMLRQHVFTNTCIASVGDAAINCTRLIEVLVMTNHESLEDGEELLLEVVPKLAKASAAKKRTWADALKHESVTGTKMKTAKQRDGCEKDARTT